MGGKSKSSSSSSSSTTNNTHNESTNSAISGDIEQGATALSGDVNTLTEAGSVVMDGSHNTIIDGGAFDFASTTIEGVGGILTQLMESQHETYSAANQLAGVAVSNMAAATGADPVEIKGKPLTPMQKTMLGLGGAASVVALAGVLYAKKGKK